MDFHKQNILKVINKLTAEELEKVSNMLKNGTDQQDEKAEEEKTSEALVVEDIEGDAQAEEDEKEVGEEEAD